MRLVPSTKIMYFK